MIRLSKNTNTVGRKPWRRRISNQLAGFAAIMLFASTQVGTSESVLNMNQAKPHLTTQNVLSEIGKPQVELSATLDGGEAPTKRSKSKKKKTFNLNLFRLRH